MKHLTIIGMKFFASIIIFAVAFDLFFEATVVEILSFSVLLTVMSYVIGDLILLQRIGNRNAVLIDFFLTYFIVWIFGSVLLHSYLQIAWGSIISATLVAVSEIFVHNYILKKEPELEKTSSKTEIYHGRLAYGFEMAEEQDPREKKE